MSELPLIWVVPFAGLLLSIAIGPLVAPHFWHAHYGKVAAAWALALLVPLAWTAGFGVAVHEVLHAILLEYIPFIAVVFALYTIAGGICIRIQRKATPGYNTALLALGTALASTMGTTGAAMLLIRPLLAANDGRAHRAHLVIFFIVLVGNVGGALSPLGDPPLFIGFLKGVDFFWTTRALFGPTLFLSAALLAVFYAVDAVFARRDHWRPPAPDPAWKLSIEGVSNLLLIVAVVVAVLVSGLWDPGISLRLFGIDLALQSVLLNLALFGLGLVSLATTTRQVREDNAFHWGPIVEVAKLFAGIFVTIIPVIAMLEAGRDGALSSVVALVTDADGAPRNAMYFWITGTLSALLDNAPTYLVFFNVAGGDADVLMEALPATLRAISMGAVYFGALTYLGNAPNFMVKAIAEDRGVAMPSFFAYTAYAALLLVPLLFVVSLRSL